MTFIAKTESPSNLGKDTRGLSSVEYLILLVVLAIAGITVWQGVAKKISEKASNAGAAIESLPTETPATPSP